jgi:hypothetical protein
MRYWTTSGRRIWIAVMRGVNQWPATDLAARLQMPKNTLLQWVRRGWVHAVRQLPGYRGRVIFWADDKELDRLQRLRTTGHNWWDEPVPEELTTPKIRSIE